MLLPLPSAPFPWKKYHVTDFYREQKVCNACNNGTYKRTTILHIIFSTLSKCCVRALYVSNIKKGREKEKVREREEEVEKRFGKKFETKCCFQEAKLYHLSPLPHPYTLLSAYY